MLRSMNKNGLGQFFFFFGLIFVGIFALWTLPRLSIPLALAYVIYFVISPLVPTFMKLGLSRNSSILIVLFGFLFFTFYPIIKVVPAIIQESKNFQHFLPKIESNVRTKWPELKDAVKEKVGYEIDNSHIEDAIKFLKDTTTQFLLNLPTFLASVLEWIFMIPLFVYFLLKQGRDFKMIILKLAPNSLFERIYHLGHKFNSQIGDYIFAKFVEASIVSFLITSGLLFFNIRFAFLFGLAAGMTNIIPYVGPILGMIPGLIFVSVEYGLSSTFGIVAVLYLVANAIDIIFVFPILVSKIVDLHLLVVVVSVILGSQYLGITGMVISIPCAAAIKLVLSEIYKEIYYARD